MPLINEFIGSTRERIDKTEAKVLEKDGVLVVDERLRRTLFFDGLFLTADHLTHEQIYFLTRQADIGRAGGSGVVNGLRVRTTAEKGTRLTIQNGQGITPAGDMVSIDTVSGLAVDLAKLTDQQRLDLVFGLSQIPRPSGKNLTGLFILGLRPVEYTSSEVTSYPTTITGKRTTNDGEIIEATAVTLVPLLEGRSVSELDANRSMIAYDMFVAQNRPQLPPNFLPLSVIALNRGRIVWNDDYLVRRELGAEQSDILGLGFAPRASREAFFLQYQNHLQDLLTTVGRPSFVASKYFRALPPAGKMPLKAINPANFTQTFFPAEVDVQFSIIPEDEILALVEESLLLPPIDLMLNGAQQESTSVMVLLPVERSRLGALQNSLQNRLTRPLLTAAPGIVYQRKPLETLLGLKARRFPKVLPAFNDSIIDSGWRTLLTSFEEAGMLWYIRRRNLAYKSEIVGVADIVNEPDEDVVIPVPGEEIEFPPVDPDPDPDPDSQTAEEELIERMRGFQLKGRFDQLRSNTETGVTPNLIAFLNLKKFSGSKILQWGAMNDLDVARQQNGPLRTKISATNITTVRNLFKAVSGKGSAHLEKVVPQLDGNLAITRILAYSSATPVIEALGMKMIDQANEDFSKEFGLKLVEIASNFRRVDPEQLPLEKLLDFQAEIRPMIIELIEQLR